MNEVTVNREKLQEYNIYAGLGGGFGGARYQFTTLCENIDDANDIAYQVACEDYDSYAGIHGIRSYDEIAEEEDLVLGEDDETIDEIYNDERESWVDYYAVLTSEDDGICPDEIVRDYIIEDNVNSEG